MKSITETKFDKVVKDSFHAKLKPLGYKKKGNNFYKQENGVGHIINLQKSIYNYKNHIHFTINTAVFLPEYWLAFRSYSNKSVPDYPTEPECILRRRIGDLRNEGDIWYDMTTDTGEEEMIQEMNKNLNQYILPHFQKVLSKDMIVEVLNSRATRVEPLEKLIVFGELGHKEKAKREYVNIVTDTKNPSFLLRAKEYGKKYGLI